MRLRPSGVILHASSGFLLVAVVTLGFASVAEAQGTRDVRDDVPTAGRRGAPSDAPLAVKGRWPWRLWMGAEAGAGWDSNPDLATAPDQRHGGGMPLPDVVPSPEGAIHVDTRGSVGRALWARLGLSFDGRLRSMADTQTEEALRLDGGVRTGNLSAALLLAGSRYDRSRTEDGSWAGRSRLRFAFAPGLGLSLGVLGTLGTRRYDVGGQTDLTAGAGLDAELRRGIFGIALGADIDRRESTVAEARRFEVTPWLAGEMTAGPFRAQVSYAMFLRTFDMPDRNGIEHILQARVEVRPIPIFGLFASFQLGHAQGDAQALSYDRVEVLGGVIVSLESTSSPPLPSTVAPIAQGPATRVRGGVRFRFRFPDARRVQVIGSFNAWNPERGELTRGADGWFEGVLPAAPGRHRYGLLVDGQPRRPPGATTYVSDGFGGEDAVLRVPEASGD